MILKLHFLGGTAAARHYRHPVSGVVQWVPRSVCKVLVDAAPHEVEIEDWWLEENPFTARVARGQGELL